MTLPLTDDYFRKLTEADLVRPDHLLGAHVEEREGLAGTRFAVWAPNARQVAVIGEFNGWNPQAAPMTWRQGGFWEAFVPGAGHSQTYKYLITGQDGVAREKADPYAVTSEGRPHTASLIWQDQGYAWQDGDWLARRGGALGSGEQGSQSPDQPISIYEVHLGSWQRGAEDHARGWFPNYRELAPRLADYALSLNYTHIELMGVMEHPYDPSWGYQVTGYYAPSRRFGSPEDFKFFVDHLHGRGLGVLLDWVPGHFPTDAHGLAQFDGQALYEYADPRKGYHPDWNTYVFDYGRNEVVMFLVGSALKWLEDYHLDGLRVDAVASMLYLDFSRTEWVPNRYGGRENLEAITFLRRLNDVVHHRVPGAVVIAEESTSFPGVTAPTPDGLGFDYKWAMGWMNDSLSYFEQDPIYRKYEHHKLTFFNVYRATERFVLAVSHDEVVHLKKALVMKMPGDWYLKRAGLRAFLGMQWLTPGKKLLFMGQEFAQSDEWDQDRGLPWHLLDHPDHRGVWNWVRDLNRVYRDHAALHVAEHTEGSLSWVAGDEADTSVYAFVRQAGGQQVLVVANLTPVYREGYHVGAPQAGTYRVLLDSDGGEYGGFGTQQPALDTLPVPLHGQGQRLSLNLAPHSVLALTLA